MWKWLGLVVVPMMAVVPLGCSEDQGDMHQQIFEAAKPKGVTEDKAATVVNLAGDWEAVIETYGPAARDGTCSNTYRITQTGSTFNARSRKGRSAASPKNPSRSAIPRGVKLGVGVCRAR